MRFDICKPILTLSVLIGVTAFPVSAFGQCEDYYEWVAGVNNWSVPENWQHQEWDPCSGECIWVPGVPDSNHQVIIRNGGTATVTGTAYAGPIAIESSQLIIQSGLLDANGSTAVDWGSQITLEDGSLSAQFEQVGVSGSGTFTQNAGTNMAGEYIILGNFPDSNGRYELNSGELSTGDAVVGSSGVGTFVHDGGTFEITSQGLGLGQEDGSEGSYSLSSDAQLQTPMIGIGEAGTGTFNQSGGTNTLTNYMILGTETTGNGTYNLSGGTFAPNEVIVGFAGKGTFVQTGGTATVQEYLILGDEPGSEGMYDLSGTGNLNVAGSIDVGLEGTGSFVMDAGTINGTTDEAEMVCASTGSLTGAGTFNIEVSYESAEMYGTYGDKSVAVSFDPCCLTIGGAYNVEWTTPENFAGGTVPNLLESSVFEVNFDGVYCGQFELTIPYDQSEVNVCDANESELLVLRETGPETYEQVPVVEIDTYDDVIYVDCNSFGKYAVKVSECNGAGLCCAPWYLGDLDHDCDVDFNDLAKLCEYWLGNEPSVDIAPIGGDRIINFKDFAVLADNWLKCATP